MTGGGCHSRWSNRSSPSPRPEGISPGRRMRCLGPARPFAASSLRRSRFVAMIREITAPTLVVQGIADHIVSPTAVEWLCFLRPDWTLVQMDHTGHTPQVDAPMRLLSVLDPWLDEHLKREMTA